MKKKDRTLLLRFCKDNDIFIDFKNIANKKDVDIKSFFDANVTWLYSDRGFIFWYNIHLNWHLYLLQNGYEFFTENHCRSCSPEGIHIYELYRIKISNKDFTPIKIK